MTSISPKKADKFKIICKIHEMPFCHCESVTIDILLPPFKYLTQIAHIMMNEASVTLCLSVSLRAFYSKYFRNSSKMIVRCESVTLVEWTRSSACVKVVVNHFFSLWCEIWVATHVQTFTLCRTEVWIKPLHNKLLNDEWIDCLNNDFHNVLTMYNCAQYYMYAL